MLKVFLAPPGSTGYHSVAMSNESPAPAAQPDTTEKVSISLPVSLLEIIDRNAVADNRTRSNYIVSTMSGLLSGGTTNTSEG